MAKKYCMPRNILLVFLVLQLISTIERQIFDFLGYMWIPILGNFFNLIFVIFGLFGLYQYRSNYMLAYAVWTLFWIGFNIFIVCFYLEVGDLDNAEDILSFGTGSFSWWLVNSPGCQPHYNTTVTEDFNPLHPMRPSYVEGCYMSYEDVEVTHAAIQLVISVVGLVMASYMSHYYITVINPKREKQGVKSMYSIEYSPHRDSSNPNTLERETDLHELENGEARPHMTPRRVKRRSYRNSARNSSKSSKSMSRNQQRQSSKSARSSGRSHKSINPVTRLIDADQNRADSSTSNEAERYGQINPGFQADQSRPNSIYNLSGPPTDIEASRPQSALTSYSNFHGQRRLPASSQPSRTLPAGVTNLTQESLMNHESNMNSSYDDLPPPPPPISSSPTPPDIDQVSDSDNASSVATAQIPVPQQRSSIRRNEYVNIPVPPQDPSPVAAIISHQEPEPQSPGPKPTNLPHPTMAPPPIPPHNYANLPGVSSAPQHQFNGARPRTTNPLYNKNEESKDYNDYTEVERTQTRQENHIVPEYESRVSYEAETLRADTKLTMPPSYYNHDPYSLSDNPSSQRSSHSEPYPQHPDRTDTRLLSHNVPSVHQGSYNEQPSHSQYNQRPYQQVPQSPRDSQSDSQSADTRYAQLEDFSNSQRDNRLNPNVNDRYYQDKPMHPNQNFHNGQITNGYPEDRAKPRTGLTNDTDSGLHSMGSDFNSHTSQDQRAGEPAMKRVPTGHQARDRASLRLKQRRDMEAKATKQNKPQQVMHNGHNDNHGYENTQAQSKSREDEYGFSGPTVNGKPNGYADMSGKKTPDIDDKWYLKDSMRPVGASNHGQNCKCYRCQRKLTAI